MKETYDRTYSVIPVILPPIYNIVYPVILPTLVDSSLEIIYESSINSNYLQGLYDNRCQAVNPCSRIPSK